MVFKCLFYCQANLKTAKEDWLWTITWWEKKELVLAHHPQTDSRWCDSQKQLHAWNPAGAEWQLMWVELVSFIHKERSHTAMVVHTRDNASSTHSDVQTHIPLVGSWSKVRKCEICQPRGDWVIEEFDSERNILLPWWWTRRNNTVLRKRKV